jgi:enoyl-CoA hydratase
MNTTSIVRSEFADGVTTVTLNRPEARNALSSELLAALPAALKAAEEDERVRAIVLTGADPAFCAGMDLSDLSWADGNHPRAKAGDTFASALRAVRKPVIAAVNGPAITGGSSSPSAQGG